MASYQKQQRQESAESFGDMETANLLANQGLVLDEAPDLASILDQHKKHHTGDEYDSLRHQMELLEYGRTRRSSVSIVDIGTVQEQYNVVHHDDQSHSSTKIPQTVDEDEEEAPLLSTTTPPDRYHAHSTNESSFSILLILMTAIPFGVAYFPVGWSNDNNNPALSSNGGDSDGTTLEQDDIQGAFPLPGKEAMGIRMCLFATMTGQLAMTFASGFENPVSFQLLENVPFYHALARIVIAQQGYGMEALATLFFTFGLSSFLVGGVFYCLGRFNLGRVTYYFPAHVLVGCIGGIGVYIALTSIEVTNNRDFTFDMNGVHDFINNIHLYGIVMSFEIFLRFLIWITQDETGHPKFRLLAPLFFCSIVPLFYFGLFVFGISVDKARDMGYMFPDPSARCSAGAGQCEAPSFHDRVFDGHVLDIFRVLNPLLIDWMTIWDSLGVILSPVSFSLIHVPINLPAFAVSSGIAGEIDMNRELMAHGYSNALSGLFGGLQNVMTYSFSILFMKSGGKGIASCLTVAFLTGVLFVYGPALAIMFPRCMAGTLLLHIGIDLFLEGVWDSIGKFDRFEYCGIWLITLAMTLHGMTAALLAGLIVALSTFALQSISFLDPIFRVMHASTLRSSAWNRSTQQCEILDDTRRGRSRILVVQLQGHLFFGNVNDVTDFLKRKLRSLRGTDEQPYILILDFSLVVGMDSSAAHAIAKLKDVLHRNYALEVTMFVTGRNREAFPCAYALSEALTAEDAHAAVDFNDVKASSPTPARAPRGSISVSPGSKSMKASMALRNFAKNHVFNNLDDALMLAEDILVAREKPKLLIKTASLEFHDNDDLELEEEQRLAAKYFENLTPDGSSFGTKKAINFLVSMATREEYQEGDLIWQQGDESDAAKLLVHGTLVATIKDADVTEHVARGNFLGELGLIEGFRRLSTVRVTSQKVILYSISRQAWKEICERKPEAARILDRIAIRYLAQRVQHVSNRIVETRCLPV